MLERLGGVPGIRDPRRPPRFPDRRGSCARCSRGIPARALAAWLLFLTAGCDRATTPAGSPTRPAPPAPNAQSTSASAPLPPLPPELREVLVLSGRGAYDDARAIARRYEQAHPDDGRGALMIGLTHHQAGNHGPAVPHLERALELSPEYYLTHHYLGEARFMLGDLAAARRHHEAHATADPQEPRPQYGLGLVDLEESRLDEAEQRFRRAIDQFEAMARTRPRRALARRSELARCHARLADVHFARDDYASARDALIRSTMLHPQNISAYYTLSLVHRRLGEDDLADQALARFESARDAIIEAQQP